ncbi:epoxyqueuosine reductase [Thermodesulfobacteriota bacterium]
MPIDTKKGLTNLIIEKAKAFGACAAGIADVEALKQSPSHLIYPQIGGYKSFLNNEVPRDSGEVLWPPNAKSAIVVAVEHPEDKPELDWWQKGLKGGTPGNQVLITIISRLIDWLRKDTVCEAKGLPYYIVQGGIFLKDAAVMAGLGCIGKNNMLVTPEYGPRVRLRAALLDLKLPATGPSDFDPCPQCDKPCRKICPQNAFQKKIQIDNPLGVNELPARTGVYSRPLCKNQMELDRENASITQDENQDRAQKVVKCCRLCETSCPVGKK